MSIAPVTRDGTQQIDTYLSLLPTAEQELLKRCALLATFDAGLLADLAAGLDEAATPSIDDVTAYPFVLRVRGRPGTYRLREDARRALLDAWWHGYPEDAVPTELSTLARTLVEKLAGTEDVDPAELAGTEDVDPAELVRLLLFVTPLAALDSWRKLYERADERFDLVECRMLLAVLSPMAAVSPEVRAVREDFQTYLEVRTLRTDEWYRTASFVLPEQSRERFEGLLSGVPGRMLEMRGGGGFGKTMHLRWLLARRCAPKRIPCAVVDFDAVEPLTATREPHLVLLEMAEQLDRQLSGDPFGTLVVKHAADLTRLYRRERATTVHARDLQVNAAHARAREADVVRRFIARLAEIPADRPVVLILDTLEVPLHLGDTASGPALERLLTLLARVHDEAPCVRVVLSGRYRIEDSVARLPQLFPAALEPLELPELSPEDARRYLVDKRRIERDDLVEAAISASERVPFSLALLADLIEHDPDVSAKKIASYRGAGYAYLIERVVKRIAEKPVRWILRYAAIPRRFDFEFVREVLWPRIYEERSGTAGRDPLADDDATVGGGTTSELWLDEEDDGQPRRDPADEDLEQIWERVRRYASGSSWVAVDRQDPDALVLQSEVSQPLRDLLAGKDIVPTLHSDAVDFFLDRSQREGRVDDLREAVFHRFQLAGAAAGAWWEERVRAARTPEVRYVLAEELARGLDYTDRAGRPLRSRRKELVSVPTLQAARLELCLASAELASVGVPPGIAAQLSDRHTLWQTAAEALDALDRAEIDTLPAGRLALARAALALGRGISGDDTEADIAAALGSPDTSPRERLWLGLLEVRLIATSSEEARERIETARRLAADAPEETELRRLLAWAVAMHYGQWSVYDRAIEACEEATQQGVADVELKLLEANLRIQIGDTKGALDVAGTVLGESAAHDALVHTVAARALRWQFRLLDALDSADRAVTIAYEQLAGTPEGAWLVGTARGEEADALSELLRVDEARNAFGEAIRTFEEAGNDDAAARCHNAEARLHLRHLGHLRAAGVALDQAVRVAPPGGDAELHVHLLRAELADRLNDSAEAETALRRAEQAGASPRRPRAQAALAIAGLAFGPHGQRDRYAEMLAASLEQISPAASRLRALTGLARCPRLKAQSRHAVRLAQAGLPDSGWDAELEQLEAPDRSYVLLHAATLARMVGDGNASELLRTALELVDVDDAPTTAVRAVLRAARLHADKTLVTDAAKAAVRAAGEAAEQYPLLSAAMLIETLEAAFETGAQLPVEPTSLCQQAEHLLAEAGSDVEAWAAKLAEIQATFDAPYEISRSQLRTAVQLFEAAGDLAAAESVRGRIGGPKEPGKTPSSLFVDVGLNRDAIASSAEGGWLPNWLRRLSPVSQELREAVSAWVRNGPTDPYPPELPDLMLRDWEGFTEALGQIIDARRVMKRASERPEFAVRVHDGALQPLPWELAYADGSLQRVFRRVYRAPGAKAPDARLVRFLQAGLNALLDTTLDVDGVDGPDTQNALSDAQAKGDLGAVADAATVQRLHVALLRGAHPRVLIIRPAPSEGRSAHSLERRYARAGMDAAVIDDAHLESAALLLRDEPPPVIVHVAGALVAIGGAIALNLKGGPRLFGEDVSLLTAADLDRLLRRVPRHWPSPLVLVESPRPSGDREALDQLLLRNGFAADLFALGGTRAVVAAGPVRSKAAGYTHDVLVERLGRGDAISDVVQVIRHPAEPKSAKRRFDDDAALAATALWTSDPGIRLPAPRRV